MKMHEPVFKIEGENPEVTKFVKNHLREARLEDQSGVHADALEIELAMPEEAPWPDDGTTLSCRLGYSDIHQDRKRFAVDQIAHMGPPSHLLISATTAAFNSATRAPKERSFNNQTFGEILDTVVSEHGYEAQFVPASLGNVYIAHIDQTGQSDLQFIHDLAETYGAMFKPVDGRWVVVSYEADLTPKLVIRPSDVTTYRTHHMARRVYRSVRAFYQDYGLASRVPVTVGSGEPEHLLPQVFVDEDTALAKARAALVESRRGAREGTLHMPGRPDLSSQDVITLEGFGGRTDGDWRITSNIHTQNKRGYTSRIELEGV
ncbi:hypothetical protein E4656_13805 [Natronospirillum operosum]|uniref:Phage late control D family protein n=1 Tax=Natronospirillum operosum TaxID=2759953 RepID=A0A4Z0WCL9_9GAMM|nr:contractile injection system protein, VgrG/Pvc8 family [Natronospirillum operosum]TGG92539.1 hypothetical protein E4656_13805 [Natronospirillum operosum]